MSEESKAKAKNDVTPVTVKLGGPHTHRGERYGKDDVITIRRYQLDRMPKGTVQVKAGSDATQ